MNLKYIGALFIVFQLSLSISSAHIKEKSDAHITGHVLDSKTGEHIPFANISLKGTSLGVVSDITGHFLFKNLPVGEHIIQATFVGYQTVEQSVTVYKDKTVEVKLSLMPQIFAIDEVVVTGSRNKTNKRVSATIVNVISPKLFEKTASNNVAEVLNFQSGLRVEYSCSNCGVPQLRINGLEGQYSQILLDSRPIFSSLASVYGLEQLPAGMIERVEVIRGGGSALFGSNAIGGVVNIITKEPLRNSVSISNQSAFLDAGGIDLNTTLNGSFVSDDYRAGIYLFGTIKNRDAYDRDADGFSDIPQVGSETIGFRAYYKLNQFSRLTAEYHHMREYRRGGNLLHRPPHEADIAEQLQHHINGGGVKYDLFTDNQKHQLSIYSSLQKIDRNSYFGTQQNLNAYGTTQDYTFVVGAQHNFNMQKLFFMPATFTWGAEYTYNNLHDEMLGYNRTIEQKIFNYGLFLQNEWKNEQLTLLLGGRLDKHNKVQVPIFSPRINIRYTPIEKLGLRASFAGGYRAPQAYDEDLHVAAVGGEVALITIAPNLKPEYSNSLSGSADFYHKVKEVEINLLAEVFYTDLRDLFTLVENGYDEAGNRLLERQNADGAQIMGVNLELKVGITPKFIVDGGFTFQKSQYTKPHKWSENAHLLPQRKMFRAPDNYGYITLNYMPIRSLSISLTGNYTGSMLVQHYAGFIAEDTEKTTDSFWDIGCRLAYDFTLSKQQKIQLSGGVKNMLNAFQSDLDKGGLRDAKYIYGPAMPRSYFVGLSWIM